MRHIQPRLHCSKDELMPIRINTSELHIYETLDKARMVCTEKQLPMYVVVIGKEGVFHIRPNGKTIHYAAKNIVLVHDDGEAIK